MATIVNKMIRVIPKKKSIEDIDCYSICKKLSETGGELWEKVIYYVNKEDNSLDIKYKSRKGRGELGIENKFDEFDVWIIENFEGGQDEIYCLHSSQYQLEQRNINIYATDEIRLVGNHEGLLKDFYRCFFYFQSENPPIYLKKALEHSESKYISFKQNSLYTAGTFYQVGEEFSREPEELNKEEFFKLSLVFYFETEFLFVYEHEYTHGIKNLINSALKDKFQEFQFDRSNLKEIQFLYNGRIVKKIEIGEHWRLYNSEFFDNSIEKNWIKYGVLKDLGVI